MTAAPVLTAYTATTALGAGCAPLLEALRHARSGLAPCRFMGVAIDTWVGEVEGVDAVGLPPGLAAYDCRNHRLALLGLQADGFLRQALAAVERYGAGRVAVILGTSTSGILATELAYRERDADGRLPAWFQYATMHNTGALSSFVRELLGVRGPACTISTACSSSAKAFATADRLLAAGVVDAAIVGGVDSLCFTTLRGFSSLELTAAGPCRPGDVERSGLSIGEAAAFALLERGEPATAGAAPRVRLTGWGESSDAYHMSAPHPEGQGARVSMEQALARARLAPADVGYVNLHGTATPANDQVEGRAVAGVFEGHPDVACSSTKGMTGHALGAAGAVEAVICALALQHALLPASVGTRVPDPEIPLRIVLEPRPAPALRHALSNSFGFGGSNATLVFSLEDPA